MSKQRNLDIHKEMKYRLRGFKGEEDLGTFKFSSCNVNLRITLGTDIDFANGDTRYEYLVEIFGDIGKSELDIEVGGSVSSAMVAETFIALDDMEAGVLETGDNGFNWGQFEVLLANKDVKEIHFAIFMDEYLECLDNYLTIKLPDYEKRRFMDFLCETYERMVDVENS